MNNKVLATKGKRHPTYLDLDPHADYNTWQAPAEFWQRENGKMDRRYVNNEEMPLIRCIRKANKDLNGRTYEEREFVFGFSSLRRWARDSDCTVEFLIGAILADKTHKLKYTPVWNALADWVDEL